MREAAVPWSAAAAGSGRGLLAADLLPVLEHSLHELLEDSVHVSALPGPDPLQEPDVAPARRQHQSHVGVLPGSLYRDGWKGGTAVSASAAARPRSAPRTAAPPAPPPSSALCFSAPFACLLGQLHRALGLTSPSVPGMGQQQCSCRAAGWCQQPQCQGWQTSGLQPGLQGSASEPQSWPRL